MAPEHVLGYQDWLNWFINKQTAIQNKYHQLRKRTSQKTAKLQGEIKRTMKKKTKRYQIKEQENPGTMHRLQYS